MLEDENATLASLSCRDNDQLLIEVRNKDLTWPEEMVSLSGQSGDKYRQGSCVDIKCRITIDYETFVIFSPT